MMTSSEEEIKSIVKDCKTANEAYLEYLKKYVYELIISDSKLDMKSRELDITIRVFTKKLLRASTIKEGAEYKELYAPKQYEIPTSLYDIYTKINKPGNRLKTTLATSSIMLESKSNERPCQQGRSTS